MTARSITLRNSRIRPLLSLDFQRANSTVVLSWPTNYADFVLESANSPTAQTWEMVTNQPQISDDQFRVSVEAVTTAQRFFRLHQQ
jgi:hypothetical protein